MINMNKYVFWLDDINILYKNGAYKEFIPTTNMTRIQQLNALSRLFIYLLILFIIFDQSDEMLFIPIIGIIMCIILYNVFEKNDIIKKKELFNLSNDKVHELQKNRKNKCYEQISNENSLNTSISNENDYYDTNDKSQYKNNDIPYIMDKTKIYKDATCELLVTDNTFMNIPINDSNKNNIPVACNADNEDINNEMPLICNDDMYRNIDDVFDRKNYQRQFESVSHNILNDQEAFASWCYKFAPTNKIDDDECLECNDYS